MGKEGLDKAYDDTVNRIENQQQGIRELAKNMLFWIVFAKRPLTTEELRHALAVEPGTRSLDMRNLCPVEDMVSSCAGLVTIDQGEQHNWTGALYHPGVFSAPPFRGFPRCTQGYHQHKLSHLPFV